MGVSEYRDSSFRSIDCNLCQAKNSDTQILAEDDGFKLLMCNRCGLRYVSPHPADLSKAYDSEIYFQGTFKVLPRRIRHATSIFNKIKRYKDKGRLLEIGCGVGPFLQIAKSQNWEIHGIDQSKLACDYIKENLGIEILNGNFLDIDLPSEYFDLVILWHALEHFGDPTAALNKVYRVLRKQGLLFLAVPNADNFVYNFFYRLKNGKNPPIRLIGVSGYVEHLYHFTPVTISKILEKNRFQILKIMPDSEVLSHCYTNTEMIIFLISLLAYSLTRRIGSYGIAVIAQKAE